jgi:hypothetical protein
MAKKLTKIQQRIEAVRSKAKQWTFETSGTYTPGGTSNFVGKVKDENGKTVIIIREDADFNHLTRIIHTSKHMQDINDMRGLANYIWERNLIPMTNEEKEEWKKKIRHSFPIDIRQVVIV